MIDPPLPLEVPVSPPEPSEIPRLLVEPELPLPATLPAPSPVELLLLSRLRISIGRNIIE